MFIDMKTQCFIEAAKCLSFTKAAEKLYISQPALSKNIAALEEECGMKLFFRNKKLGSVQLTPAGAVMLCEIKKAAKILDGTVEKAHMAESGQEGHLVIGLRFGQIFNDIIKDVLNEIDDNYPNIEIEKISGGFRDLRTWLEDGTADMVVTYEEEAGLVKDVLYEEVAEVNLGFAVPKGHKLAEKKKINLRDIEGEKVIIPDEREIFTMHEKFRESCFLEGFAPNEVYAADLNHMNLMVEMGKGIIITSEDLMITKSPNVKFLRCKELGKAKLVAAWKKDNLNPIITFYHEMYEKIYHEGKKTRAT
jgi:DNA-binding transcriptional LysR family regulator